MEGKGCPDSALGHAQSDTVEAPLVSVLLSCVLASIFKRATLIHASLSQSFPQLGSNQEVLFRTDQEVFVNIVCMGVSSALDPATNKVGPVLTSCLFAQALVPVIFQLTFWNSLKSLIPHLTLTLCFLSFIHYIFSQSIVVSASILFPLPLLSVIG